ncbi:MAG: penicillin-binding protein [Microbacteriaceae bacterium]|nr:penicillin-binding protein [Microbacteriaceae bacterium]
MDTAGLTEFLDDHQFSGVVLVCKGSSTVFESATGLASRRTSEPITMDTRFDTASITKLFTSVAVLQQVAEGNLDLETSIHHYVDLAGTRVPIEVTLLNLLTHTSGLADDADEENGEDYAAMWAALPVETFLETKDFLPLFVNKEPLADPGDEVAFINVGYILAGMALERVTGMSYRDYVQERVFAPAGMTQSGFFDRREAKPTVAEGWDQDENGEWVSNERSYPPIGSPDGGAHSTAGDLVKFFAAVRAGKLLTKEYTEEFLLPQVELDEETSYGFGLEFDFEDGLVRSYFQEGINAGASGILRHYVRGGLDVVVLSNSEDGAWDVITEIDERID